jgi:hypothetical protein
LQLREYITLSSEKTDTISDTQQNFKVLDFWLHCSRGATKKQRKHMLTLLLFPFDAVCFLQR